MTVPKQIIFLSLGSMVVAMFLLSCSKQANSEVKRSENIAVSNVVFNRDEFERNRSVWGSKNFSDYEMTMEITSSSNVAKKVTVKVKNGKALSTERADPADKGSTEQYRSYDTIDKVFDFIDRESRAKDEVFVVRYALALGYPDWFYFDRSTKVADDEFAIKISNLKKN